MTLKPIISGPLLILVGVLTSAPTMALQPAIADNEEWPQSDGALHTKKNVIKRFQTSCRCRVL